MNLPHSGIPNPRLRTLIENTPVLSYSFIDYRSTHAVFSLFQQYSKSHVPEGSGLMKQLGIIESGIPL